MPMYEIVRDEVADMVTELPAPAEVGEVILYEDGFWRVDAIEAAASDAVDGRLFVSCTTDSTPKAT